MKSLMQQLKTRFSLILSSGPVSEPAWLSLREQLLQLVVLGGAILGALALLPSAVLIVVEGKWGVAALDFLFYEWILSLLLFRRYFSYTFRARSLCLLVYLLGLTIFFKLGPLRPGIIYLFCFQILATVLLGRSAAVYAGIMNALALIGVGFLLHTGHMDLSMPQDRPVFRWTVIAINFMFVGAVITTIIIAVTNGMNRALHMEKIAADSIQEKAQAQMMADQALEASEKRFALALQGSREGLWDWNLQNRSVVFSPAWKTMLGYKEEDISNTIDEFTGRLHPEDKDRVMGVLDSVRAKGGRDSFKLECTMRHKEGEYHTFLIQGYAQRDGHGDILRIIGSQTNLTQISRVETALQESEEKYMALVEQSLQGVAIFAIDPPSLIYSNRALGRMLGYSPNELKDFTLDQMKKWVHPGDWLSVVRCVERYLARKPVPPLLEYRLNDRDGNLVWIEASCVLIRYQRQDALLMTSLDITQKKMAEQEKASLEEQLRQAKKNQGLGGMAESIANDFRQYLTPILGYAEMAEQSLPADHPARQDMLEILRVAREAKDLACQISEFGSLPKQMNESTNVVLVAEDVIRKFQRELPEKIQLKKRLDRRCRTVRGDPSGIRQIIYTLCSRAVSAMTKTGGEVTVTVKETHVRQPDLLADTILVPGMYLSLSVAQTGTGTTWEGPPKLDNPLVFNQARQKESTAWLVLVQSIVNRHKGEFQVSSHDGEGLAYKVILPVEGEHAEITRVVDIGDLPPGNEWILLVDDEKPILDMTRQTLERLGYQVTALSSSQEAWKKFQENPGKYDIVITDYNMPEMTGDKLVKKLFSLRPQIPVIMCTGFSEKFSESLARELGIVEYVTKPVLMQEFAHTIRKVLDGPPDESCTVSGQSSSLGRVNLAGSLGKIHSKLKI